MDILGLFLKYQLILSVPEGSEFSNFSQCCLFTAEIEKTLNINLGFQLPVYVLVTQFVEERVGEGLGRTEPSGRAVAQDVLHQVCEMVPKVSAAWKYLDNEEEVLYSKVYH